MNTILISYDLIEPGRDYTNLWDHLKSYGTWSKPLESVWLIKTDLTAAEVRDAAKEHVDQNDKILTIDVTDRSWATRKIPGEIKNWIKTNL